MQGPTHTCRGCVFLESDNVDIPFWEMKVTASILNSVCLHQKSYGGQIHDLKTPDWCPFLCDNELASRTEAFYQSLPKIGEAVDVCYRSDKPDFEITVFSCTTVKDVRFISMCDGNDLLPLVRITVADPSLGYFYYDKECKWWSEDFYFLRRKKG